MPDFALLRRLAFEGNFYFNLALFLAAIVVSAVMTPLMRVVAFRVGALDFGRGRRVHEGVVPRLGGGGFFAALLLVVGFGLIRIPWGPNSGKVLIILGASALVFAIGAWDDVRRASIRNKLVAEIAATTIIWAGGVRIDTLTNPFGGAIELGLLSLPVTILWVVIVTNALNLVDGMDGLAGATGILITGALFVVAPDRGPMFTLVCVALVGGLLGFLAYNLPPARIFMGDSGSLLLGFMLAALSILSSAKATAMATMLLPIIAFAHPLLDMSYAVLRRMYRGLPLGSPDREHIHHKLIDMGLSRRSVLGVLVSLNVVVLGVAWIIVSRRQPSELGLLLVLAVLFLGGLRLFGYIKFRKFFRDYARVARMGREQRYAMYMVRQFRNGHGDVVDLERFREGAHDLLGKVGLTAAKVSLALPGVESRDIVLGTDPPAGERYLVSYPVLDDGVEVGRARLYGGVHVKPAVSFEISKAISEVLLALEKREGGR